MEILIGVAVVALLVALVVWWQVRRDNPRHRGSDLPRQVSDGAPRTPPPGTDSYFRSSG